MLSRPGNIGLVRWDRNGCQVTLLLRELVLEIRVILHCHEGRQKMPGAEKAVIEEHPAY